MQEQFISTKDTQHFLTMNKTDPSFLLLSQLYGEQIKQFEISNRLNTLQLASMLDPRVAAKTGVCNFLSTYLPISIAFGIGAGLAQSGVNIANRVNGPR